MAADEPLRGLSDHSIWRWKHVDTTTIALEQYLERTIIYLTKFC